MSNRDSLGVGELLPQDVIHVFTQDKHSKKGRKKRTRSLGRAFNWFKRKKRKTGSNGQNHGLGPALDLALDGHRAGHHGGHKGGQKSGRQTHHHGNSHAVPKIDDDDKTPAPPQFQENVFIEGSRSKYVEDLHTEALEGLKMMQQEENGNGVEYKDDESTVSTVTVQTDGESAGFMTDSTIADSSSVISRQSSVSARSSRSGLTRQGSTFRPLNSGKKSEKSRTRRRHRRTVAGIPRHVQKELGLDRVGWTVDQRLDEEQVYNGDTDNSPLTESPQQEAEKTKESGASFQSSKIIHPLSKEKVAQLNASHAAHRDDLALLHRLSPHTLDERRPRSLAVPWMTTASSLQQKPPSPVMTMSPQAAYMSKIIPNAVLPPSIDVVEISRNRSCSSVRTVSKSSLLLSSPAPSRASSRASSSRTTSSNITSASRYIGQNLSDASCWSTSGSSDTLVSDSSTISTRSAPRRNTSRDVTSAKDEKVDNNFANGMLNPRVMIKGEQKDGQFVRSLSVMKSKRAPPPPSRSYSLHSKMKRRSQDLAEVEVEPAVMSKEEETKNSGSSRCLDSPGYHGDTSSLDDSTGSASFTFQKSQLQAPKIEKSEKKAVTDRKEASGEKQKQPIGLLSPSSGYSSQDGTSPKEPPSTSPKHKKGFLTKLQRLFTGSTAASLPSSLPTHPEVAKNDKSTLEPKHDTVSTSPSVQTLRELFNIPPPPKVHAPPPPPPEVWAHSKRTFELLLGPPAPDNIYAIIKKNPKDRRQQRQSLCVSREGSVKSVALERKHKNAALTVEPVNESLESKKVQENGIVNVDVRKENTERFSQNQDVKCNSKEEKVRGCDILNQMLSKAVGKHEERLAVIREQKYQKIPCQATEMSNSDSLTISSSMVDGPLQSTNIQTIETSASVQVVSPESAWPPPPPPMAQVSITGTDGLDFPLPPPPFFGEEGLNLSFQGSKNVPISSMNLLSEASLTKQEVKEPLKLTSSCIPPPPPYTAPSLPTIETKTSSLQTKESSVSTLPVEEAPQTTEKAAPLTNQAAPERIPPPPPLPTQLQPAKQKMDLPNKNIQPVPDTQDLPNSILIPQSIPPPPPSDSQLKPSTNDTGSDEAPILPPSEFRNVPSQNDAEELASTHPISIPLPPPLPAQVPASNNHPLSIESQQQATARDSDINREQTTVITPSLLKMVKLRSVNNSPEPADTQEQASSKGVQEEPPSIVTSSLLQIVQLRSVNNSPEPPELAGSVKEEPTPSFLQKVKLRSINNSPEPAEAIKDGNEELVSNSTSPSEQTVKLQAINKSPEPSESQETVFSKGVHEEPPSVSTSSLLQMVKLHSVNSSPEPPDVTTGVKEEATPSFLQEVKLRSINNSPEPEETVKDANEESVSNGTSSVQKVQPVSINGSVSLESQEQPKPEAPVNKQLSDKELPTSSSNSEAPQKPVRKSLIMTCPTSTSPPATITSQQTLTQSQPVVVPSTTSPSVVSPIKKSPPATTSSGSMNLQEAIRLRTAARSKQGPASRLSPLSPLDFRSPTSTASFIFSKSSKMGVVEKKDKKNVKNFDFSLKKVESEGESKMERKVPPPVAKKPKTKGKEEDTNDAVEQTAGQEAQQDGLKDATDEINGTAGTVQGGT
ncbi:uncharacterized protein KIAA1522 homolog [Cyprinodon tularosa]|uniref:uncharacterized protein KIAA1522 homolog n=1 Tax=Cyprinodon tularosa TaxID=77115 RepID=UPI0018E200A6|nr:uncharacterized protein KIAA1522 homolog [Cyprinodon tularosa]